MILRIGIVIPTYNNPETIADVVNATLKATHHPIFIFDDGSKIPVAELLPSNPRLQIFRSEENQGKGATLARAIQTLVAQGFTHMLTLDGDGQHLADACRPLIEAARREPWSLI